MNIYMHINIIFIYLSLIYNAVLKLRLSLGSRLGLKRLRLAKAQAPGFKSRLKLRLRLKLLDTGLGSGSQLSEPRLPTLRFGVFEPMDNISYNSHTTKYWLTKRQS
jgi:hypothetical protein